LAYADWIIQVCNVWRSTDTDANTNADSNSYANADSNAGSCCAEQLDGNRCVDKSDQFGMDR
jgi:hypothetical protein